MPQKLFVLSALLVLGASGALAQMTESEEAVWRLEEAYYRYVETNDPEGFRALFHEDIIGWPALDPVPIRKNRVGQWIAAVHENPAEVWRYELDRQAIEAFGDVVVVHYFLRDYFVSAESDEEIRSEQFRISHTWKREGDSWQIISGMGGRLNH